MKGAFRFDANLRPRIDVGYRAALNPVDRVVGRKFQSIPGSLDRARMTPHNIPRFIQPPPVVPRLSAFRFTATTKHKGSFIPQAIIDRLNAAKAAAGRGAIPSAATLTGSDTQVGLPSGKGSATQPIELPEVEVFGTKLPGWALPALGVLLLILFVRH